MEKGTVDARDCNIVVERVNVATQLNCLYDSCLFHSSANGPFLWIIDTELPTQRAFIDLWRSICGYSVGTSSFRAGGATHMALTGLPPTTIRRWGRWSSDAWDRYVRYHPAMLAASRQFGN
ncbi:hypothetical protein BDZ88DRAFT_401049 [Geranomyces variabilis]|nr:hypothetical protein BDZ88DRAFT_401049 [Geranomyces variabilis]